MAIRLASTSIEFNAAGLAGVRAQVAGLEGQLRRLQGFSLGGRGGIGLAGSAGLLAAALRALGPVLAAVSFGKIVQAASTAETSVRRFAAVFRELGPQMEERVRAVALATNASVTQIRDSFSSFQAIATGFEFTDQQAAALSERMVRLSRDFASFFGIADAEASQRFLRALEGSGEVLDQFGFNVRRLALDAELIKSGIAGGIDAATEAQKLIARASLISKTAVRIGIVGAAERNTVTFASAMNRAAADLRDTMEQLGSVLLPILSRIINGFVDMSAQVKAAIGSAMPVVREFAETFAIGAQEVFKMIGAISTLAVGPLASLLGQFNDIRDVLLTVVLGIQEVGFTLIKFVATPIRDIAAALADFVSLFDAGLAGTIREFVANMDEGLKAVRESIDERAQNLVDAFARASVKIKQDLGKLPEIPTAPAGATDSKKGRAALTTPAEAFRALQAGLAADATLEQVIKAQTEKQIKEAADAADRAEDQREQQLENLRAIIALLGKRSVSLFGR